MSITEKLELLLTLDPSQGVRGLDEFAKKSKDTSEKVGTDLAKIGSTALKLGAAGLTAGTFFTVLGDKEKQASAQLETAIRDAGQSVDDYSAKIEEAVKHGENFGTSAVETKAALTTLVGAYGDTGAALNRMQLVEDLAAARHISLASAADLVAKVHAGSTKILKLYDIQVGLNADGTKNYEGALDSLSQKVSGQASSSIQGFSGLLSQLRAKLEDAAASFGEKYGVQIQTAAAATTVFGVAATGVAAIQGKLAAASAAAAISEGSVAASAGAAAIALTGEAAAATAAWTAMLGPVGIAIVLGDALANLGDDASTAGMSVKDFTAGLQSGKITGYGQGIDVAASSLKDLGSQMATISIPTAQKYADALDAAGISTTELRSGIDEVVASTDGQAQMQDIATAATDKLTKAHKDAIQALQDEATAAKKLNDAEQSLVDTTLSSFQDALALTDAQIASRKAIDDATKANKDHKLSQDEKTKATDAAYSSILNEAKAAETMYTDTLKANGATITAAQSQGVLVGELQKVIDQLDPGSPLRAQLQAYIDTLNSVPTNIHTDFNVYVNEITSSLQVGGPGGPPHKQYALGGMVDGPIGKPQLAIVHGGEFVSTAQEVASARSRGSSGFGGAGQGQIVFAPVFNIQTLDPQAAGRSVHDALHNYVRDNPIATKIKEAMAS